MPLAGVLAARLASGWERTPSWCMKIPNQCFISCVVRGMERETFGHSRHVLSCQFQDSVESSWMGCDETGDIVYLAVDDLFEKKTKWIRCMFLAPWGNPESPFYARRSKGKVLTTQQSSRVLCLATSSKAMSFK